MRYIFRGIKVDSSNVLVVQVHDTELNLVTHLALTGADAEELANWFNETSQEDKDSLQWQEVGTL